MTSKQLLNNLCYEYNTKNFNEERLIAVQKVKKDLEVLEIIHKNPVIVWYCVCYESAYEMITDRPGFMIDYSMTEIENQFNKVKEWLKND